MSQTNFISHFKNLGLYFATILIVPFLLFFPLHSSIVVNEYTSFLKWICLLGPIVAVSAAIQCAKSEQDAKKFIWPFVGGLALFFAILLSSSGSSITSATGSISFLFCVIAFGASALAEFVRYKLVGYYKATDPLSMALSLVVPGLLIGAAYLYDADLVSRDRMVTHGFAYAGLMVALVFNDAAFQYARENSKTIANSTYLISFALLNAFSWMFFAVLFVLV